MVLSEDQKTNVRKFVRQQLRDAPDLSTLTIRILKQRYLGLGRESESSSASVGQFLKQVVKEELVKMQDNDQNENELETTVTHNKRKRKVASDSENEVESKTKKSRKHLNSSSEDDCDPKSGSEESEDDEEHMKSASEKVVKKTLEENTERDQKIKSEHSAKTQSKLKTEGSDSDSDSSSLPSLDDSESEKKQVSKSKKTSVKKEKNEDDDDNEPEKEEVIKKNSVSPAIKPSEMKRDESESDSSLLPSLDDSEPEKVTKLKKTMKKEAVDKGAKGKKAAKGGKAGQRKQKVKRDKEDGSDKESSNSEDSSADEEEKVLPEKKVSKSDSESSSSQSPEPEKKQSSKKKKAVTKKGGDSHAKTRKEDNKAVVRLKGYISLCGVRKNYKKLLGDCRSIASMVAVLKKELEDLGVEGQPSVKKCKKARMKREEAQELAGLDVSNIIATEGRPQRRGASTWQEKQSPPFSAYHRSLKSSSDSDEENKTPGRRRGGTNWANLQGIISDDADSN